MYDRLNDSNNSNDGRDVKHSQERPQKRKRPEKSSKEKKEDRTTTKRDKKTTVVDNAECRAPNWTTQHICSAKSAECRKCKRGHYEKMCRILKRIKHVDRTASSAEENWDCDKIQKINTNKKKGDYIYVALLKNNTPVNIIIDSGSPVTLIPQRLFNKTTKIENLNTNYKDVSDNNIEFV